MTRFNISIFSIAILFLYIGGWYLVFDEAWVSFPSEISSGLAIGNGIAIRFNSSYYGIAFESRFFSSPVLSWALGLVAFAGLWSIFEPKGTTSNS